MRKLFNIIIAGALYCMATSFTPANTQADIHATQAQTVYISTGGYGKRYHCTSDCSGLSNASGIRAVSLEEAKRLGKTACHVCY